MLPCFWGVLSTADDDADAVEGKHEQVVDVVPDHANCLGPHQLTARNKPDQGHTPSIYSSKPALPPLPAERHL
ncbi:hypothetical protein ElyMa_002710600 [Elysia marginata]|uniref:Uncharacterized protein n=1 Tax=Elysia marginata TaxID=1093978 RepID=A0AAV4HEN5_9GAST|nr:hypothetical protein ElyMa_002710600 [Elysia marginata]